MTEMTRREWLAGAAGLIPGSRKPNLLYVFSDAHRACSMPGEPYNEAQAPNLAAFAKEATAFRNCISNYPVCSPYRAMLMTGRWPYQTGIVDNGIQLRDSEVSLGEVFQGAGYHTGYIGKWHLSHGDEQGIFIPKGPGRQGFEDWHVWSKTNQHFDGSFTFDPDTGEKIQPKGYNCTRMTDTAVDFIGKNRSRPWMLMVSWNPPHVPYEDAPPEYMARYKPEALKLRPNVAKRGEAKTREWLQGYYAHISAVDAEFGRLMRALRETGQVSNTTVVYTSDHGSMIGSQGYGGKRLPWEESCRVPFLVRYPGVAPAGRTNEVLLSAIDIYPSLCGLAGIPVPGHCVGRDLSGTMRGENVRSPESALIMHIQNKKDKGGKGELAPVFRGARTTRYTYAVARDGRWCLYDNREDPYQMRNLIGDPARASLTRELDGVVIDWLKKAGDPFPYESARRLRMRKS